MKILLTGASGFLGLHAAKELSRRGHQITAMVRKTSKIRGLQELSVRLFECTLPDCEKLESILPQIDGVVHIAGLTKALSKNDFFLVNNLGTQNLVRKILNTFPLPKFFLHVSTIAVHNPAQGSDFCLPPEKCNPVSYYGQSKRQGELALAPLLGKIPTTTLRPPVLYGPEDQDFLPVFKSISRGLAPLYKKGQNKLSVCYVEDVARAIGDIVEHLPEDNPIYCLDDGFAHTWKNLTQEIAFILKQKARYVSVPVPVCYLAAGLSQAWAKLNKKPVIFTLNKLQEIKQNNWVCGSEKIRRQLGWSPSIGLRDGLQKTFNYYLGAGLLKHQGSR